MSEPVPVRGADPTRDPAAAPDPRAFELYRLYLATAEKVSDRRAAANAWLLSVNSAIAALYGLLYDADIPAAFGDAAPWMMAIPVAGVLVCLAWAALLASFAELNKAKFAVLHEMEADLPFAPFTREQAVYRKLVRKPFATIEKRVPLAFMALHAALLAALLLTAMG